MQLYASRLRITSLDALARGLKQLGINVDDSLSPWCWVHNLLTKSHRQIRRLEDFGLEAIGESAGLKLEDLTAQLDADLIQLSEAHYQRYYALAD